MQSDQSKKVEIWLSPPNPSINHNSAKEKHLEGTGQWFLKSNEFLSWRTYPNSALWLHGIPGCGKTILSSTIIQQLHHTSDETNLVYFFFDFSDIHKRSFQKMVHSLAFQLSGLNTTAKRHLDKLFKDCREGQHQPELKSLCATFYKMSKEVPDLTILLDALDECEIWSREPLMKWLGNLESRVLITSRKVGDIQSSIREWKRPVSVFSFRESLVNDDIRAYVRQKLGRNVAYATSKVSKESKLAKKWRGYEKLLTEIEMKLTEKADGMLVTHTHLV